MKSVYLMPNELRDKNLELTSQVASYLRLHGIEVLVRSEQSSLPDDRTFDMAICLGGDGTVLRAAGEMLHSKVPLFGINVGHLGYLTDADSSSWQQAMDSLICGKYYTEARERLLVHIETGSEVYDFLALNDLVLHRSDASGSVETEMCINGVQADVLKGDGVIIATPTGSTAYNLSAGGPILNPVARGFVVTPLCNHSKLNASLVMTPQDQVQLIYEPEFQSQSAAEGHEAPMVCVDGLWYVRLTQKSTISICCAPEDEDMILARLDQKNFYSVLKNKIK